MEPDLDDVMQEGWDAGACSIGQTIDVNPYLRGTLEFDAWRKGWAAGDYARWQGFHRTRQKASAE